MTDSKFRASNEIAITSSDGKEGAVRQNRTGELTPPGTIPLDGLLTIADIPMPLSVDVGDDGIVTLTPSSLPESTSIDYISRVVWVAVYSDGSQICEYDENGENNSSEDIDRQRLREFKLIDSKSRTVISQEIVSGQCFFYRRRTALQTGRDVVEVMHMFGWRRLITPNISEEAASHGNIEKEYLDHLIVLYESDMHVECGCFDSSPVDPSANLSGRKSWKYPPNWRDIDEIPAV